MSGSTHFIKLLDFGYEAALS